MKSPFLNQDISLWKWFAQPKNWNIFQKLAIISLLCFCFSILVASIAPVIGDILVVAGYLSCLSIIMIKVIRLFSKWKN